MAQVIGKPQEASPLDREHLSRSLSPRLACGGLLVAAGVMAGAWVLDSRSAPGLQFAAMPPKASVASVAAPTLVAALDPAIALVLSQIPLGQSAPLPSGFVPAAPPVAVASVEPPAPEPSVEPSVAEAQDVVPPVQAMPTVVAVVQDVPLPTPRPPELRWPASRPPLRPLPRHFAQNRPAPVRPAPPDNRSFFEKLFGMPQPTGPALAYAAPESGVISTMRSVASSPMASYDSRTAVYDIAAHTVYMPGGARLEAHSGLGHRLDDPRFVHERNRGATPPQVYDLALREQPFHGVRALRLNPVGGGGVFGRVGLLAHSFMLGPNGDSNGCVSFRDYNAFLQAYLNGEVKRLSVVASRG